MKRPHVAIILLALIALPTSAMAQQSTLYDPFTGKAVGRSVTDSQGTTTLYGPGGSATIRRSPTTGETVITYDARSGRAIGKVSKDKRDGR